MNFEISQKKLSDLKGKFLSNYVNDKNLRNLDNFILIMDLESQDDDFSVIEPLFEYDHYDGRLFVRDDVFYTYSDLFGVDTKTTISEIISWFEKKFNVKVESFA